MLWLRIENEMLVTESQLCRIMLSTLPDRITRIYVTPATKYVEPYSRDALHICVLIDIQLIIAL